MESDPLELDKCPDVIKEAQNEIATLDVLVCGKCHETFHYVEQFQEHRASDSDCTGVSQLKDVKKTESKPQAWGYLLWKHMNAKASDSETKLTPWLSYQKWCKIDENHKNSWITAGQSLLFFNKITSGRVQELKAGLSKKLAKIAADDTLEEGEIRRTKVPEKIKKVAEKRPVLKSTQPTANSASAIKNGSPKKGLRTCKNDILVMGTIEKILNRRFNAKLKTNEYLIKWADSEDTISNTWEPRKNVEMCKILLDEFDQGFDHKIKPYGKSNDSIKASTEVEEPPTSGRPQRTSKKKALNQVKAWCGDITDEIEEIEKRKFLSDDESSDSLDKKLKMEADTDSSEDERPPVTIRKVGRPPLNSYNGLSKKAADMAGLVPAQRVVRVSQKQMPNLATGVYLMSKTDGIVKLDSNTPSGSPMRVGQKIGQTQIKMVQKKEGGKTPGKPGPKYIYKVDGKTVVTSTPKPGHNILRKNSSFGSAKPSRISESDKHDVFTSKVEDDDSDGLEELEFPTDLPLPPPDSPPREFTLCPLTGKVLGPNGEPQEEEEVVEEEEKKKEEDLPEKLSLDTLVKIAVMGSDESEVKDVVKHDPVPAKTNVVQTAIPAINTTPRIKEESKIHTITDIEMDIDHSEISKSFVMKSTVSSPMVINTPSSTTKAPLLNRVLTTPRPSHSAIHRVDHHQQQPKKLLSTPSNSRQRVVSSPLVSNTSKPLINRPAPTTTIIHKVSSNRPKTVLPRPSPHDPVLKRTTNVTTYKPAVRRVPGTIPSPKPIIKPIISKVISTSQQPSQTHIQHTPTSIINMPLLTAEEEQEQQQQQASTSQIVTPLAEIEQPLVETPSSANEEMGELSTYNMMDPDSPILITGEDGTIYQVAGQNEEGQTILISEGPDGQQQCVIVSSENLVLDNVAVNASEETEVTEPTFVEEETEAENADGESSQVVAQIVEADPPSPGGTRKVVLLLPDGSYVKTEVSAEQYAAI